MKKRVLSAFPKKIINENSFKKSLSLSKYNSTESKTRLYPKNDYFDLLTQIKNKNIMLGTPPTLFHQFIKKTVENSLKKKLNKTLKYKTQDSLLTTENTNDIRSASNNKSNNILTYQGTNQFLFSNKINETPKTPLNIILKIKKEKKNFIKTNFKKKYIPMERRDSYKNVIEKMNKYNYMKYSGSNSNYAHRVNTEIYITQENIKEKKENNRNKKYLQYLRDKFEDEKEVKDKVYYPSLELEKIKKKIRTILLKQHEEEPEEFFKIYVNQVNFLQDNYKVPNIKNNLLNIKYKDIYGYDNLFGLKSFNRMSNNIVDNLSRLKIRKQREKEEKMNFLFQKGEITKRYLYFKKLSKKGIYNSKEEIEKIIYKNFYLEDDDWERILENKNIDDNDLEAFKNFFEDKYEKRIVSVPDEKTKKYFYQFLDV